MPNTPKQIHEFPREFVSLSNADLLPASAGGLTGKITIANLRAILLNIAPIYGLAMTFSLSAGDASAGQLRSATSLETIASGSTISLSHTDRHNDNVSELINNLFVVGSYFRAVGENNAVIILKITEVTEATNATNFRVTRIAETGAIANNAPISIDLFSSPASDGGGNSFLPSAAAILRVRFDNSAFVSAGMTQGQLRFNDDLVNGLPSVAFMHQIADGSSNFYLYEFLDGLQRGSRLYFMKDAENLIALEVAQKPTLSNNIYTIPIAYAFSAGQINNNDLLGGTLVASPGARERPSAALTLYVRTDGNDNNFGTSDDANGAFLTWQKAIDFVSENFELTQDIIIQAGGSGVRSFSPNITIKTPPGIGGRLILRGDTTTPANCLFSGSGTHIRKIGTGTAVVEGFRFTCPVFNPNVIFLDVEEGFLQYKTIEFDKLTQAGVPANYAHIYVGAGAKAQPIGSYAITNGMGTAHIIITEKALMLAPPGSITVNITNTPRFSYFYFLGGGSDCNTQNISWSGGVDSSTSKFLVKMSSTLRGGNSANIPGAIAGTQQTGGQVG
jgi:hypothetical protein